MEELILQNLGNISLAGALLIIAIYYRPVMMQREQNNNARDERNYALSIERAKVDLQTANVLSDLKASLENGQSIAQMQHETMRRLADRVQEMTDDSNKGFERIRKQIEALPDEVWKTGDPRLAALVEDIKEHITNASATKEAEMLDLLRDILARIKTTEDNKPKEGE